MDDIEAKERVKKWLEYCDDNNIKPWEFDFKQCYIKAKLEKNTSHLCLEIAYKSDLLEETNNEFNVTNKKGEDADCDKEALPMYKVLGWQKSKDDQIRGESINSFYTTFSPLVSSTNKTFGDENKKNYSEENEKTWKKINREKSIRCLNLELSDLAKNDNFDEEIKEFEFNNINKKRRDQKKTEINLLKELKDFAIHTHSIGNFIVLPYQINSMRAVSKKDYWDLTLKDVHEFLLGINQQDTGLKRKIAQLYPHLLDMDNKQGSAIWDQFIEKYYLQPYVDEDYIPQELWEGHFENGQEPKKIEDFEQFYHNVNLLIEERGKWITKKLYEKVHSGEELNECSLYQTELANLELHYFEEATTQTQKN